MWKAISLTTDTALILNVLSAGTASNIRSPAPPSLISAIIQETGVSDRDSMAFQLHEWRWKATHSMWVRRKRLWKKVGGEEQEKEGTVFSVLAGMNYVALTRISKFLSTQASIPLPDIKVKRCKIYMKYRKALKKWDNMNHAYLT